jgi:hypothetical protein
MNLREILVLLISFFLAVTIILTFRKIINYRKSPNRKSQKSSVANGNDVKVELEEFSDEDFMDDDMPPEPEPSSDNGLAEITYIVSREKNTKYDGNS